MAPNQCFYDGNIITNGGFESLLSDWNVESGSPSIVSSTHPYNDGTKACGMHPGDIISQDLEIENGRTYVFRIYSKFGSEAALNDSTWDISIVNTETSDVVYRLNREILPTLPIQTYLLDVEIGWDYAITNPICAQVARPFGNIAPPIDTGFYKIVITGPNVDVWEIDVLSLGPASIEGVECETYPFLYVLEAKPSPIFTAIEGGPNPKPMAVKIAGEYGFYDPDSGTYSYCSCWWITDIDNPRVTSSKMSGGKDCNDAANIPLISVNTQGLQAGEYSGIMTLWGGFGDSYEVGVYWNVISQEDDSGPTPGDGGDPPELIDTPCLIVQSNNRNPTAYYYVRLLDTNFNVLAIFDDWRELEFTNFVNDVGNYSFTINGDDDRCDLFKLDYIVEVWRSLPGLGVDWYREFIGFHRGERRETDSNGDMQYISYGVSLHDLLARTIIGYLAGTINADKDDYSDRVMKEYVEENCGPSATILNGRLSAGTFLGFSTDNAYLVGAKWSGSRAFEILLDVLKEIAQFSNIDFDITSPNPGEFFFKTYPAQLGRDRTDETLDSSTGLNAYGAVPMVFDLMRGNVEDMAYEYDRSSECNVVYVPGKGDGSTRDVVVRSDATKIDSPWNRREVSRPGGSQEFIYQLEDMGDEELQKLKGKEQFDFTHIQTALSAYGKHYFLGDRVNAVYGSIKRAKRIVKISVSVSRDAEQVKVSFADRSQR